MSDERFTAGDVGFLILEAVAVLHARGHQRVRILPGMSASGMHWRVAVTTTREPEDGFRYTTGSRFEVGETTVGAGTTADELADHVLEFLPDEGLGEDAGYARWYAGLIDLVRRERKLPIAYADYYALAPEWEIGWGSGITVGPPPAR